MLTNKLNINFTRKLQILGAVAVLLYGAQLFLTANLPAVVGAATWQALLLLCALALLRIVVRRFLFARSSPHEVQRFDAVEPLSYLLCVPAAAALTQWPWAREAISIVLLVAIVLAQVAMYMWTIGAPARAQLAASEKYIAVLFLISGFSALIYQVVWQRILFATFGINSESVTIIVSVFMFGLGLGSLAGGYIQKKYPNQLLRLFLALEILIGLFGLGSATLIEQVGAVAGQTSVATLVMWVYLILAVPTLLMGATLPILVAWLERHVQNIGQSVGLLYAFNTVGSAFAAFFTVQVLFVLGGLHAAVLTAAACNFITASLIFDAGSKIRRVAPAAVTPAASAHTAAPGAGLSFGLIFLLLASIGYISLSQEILWYRLLGFMTASRPQVFGLLLAAFLLGIAGGSLRSKSLCEPGARPWTFLLGAIASAAVVFYLTVPLVAWTAALAGKHVALVLGFAAVAFVAYCTGGILPLLMHVGVTGRTADSAQAVSWLYFANIIGATLGPLVTGFILLEYFSLEANIVLLNVVTLVLLAVLLLATPHSAAFRAKAVVATVVVVAGAWLAHGALYRNHLEMLQYASAKEPPFVHVLENRTGILTVGGGPENIDVMYGNGIYDGRFNIDPLHNLNLVDRAYMVVNLHRRPSKILEIGLSTGSWTQIVASHPLVKDLTVVEINKGYPALLNEYPEVRGILNDPKIHFVFDDGRRWLRNHPDERFDFILMNTTHHWRSNSTNLLSAEFLRMAKNHLAPGGIIYYNATGSPDVLRTAATVFQHVVTYNSFVAASDAPFNMSLEERRANLRQFPMLKRDAQREALIDKYAAHQFEDQAMLRDRADLWVTTDDNMAVEYKAPHYQETALPEFR